MVATPRAARLPWIALASLWLAVLTGACDDLKSFRTSSDEVFVGSVVGNQAPDAGDAVRPFILIGFEARTTMELTFDPEIVGSGESPGRMTTYVCEGALDGPCPVRLRTPGPIDDAALVPIVGLQHDALSGYDFPGASRLRNYMFHVRMTRNGGRDAATVFISLMESGRVEARLIAPGSGGDGGDGMFGVFRLNRTQL